MAIEIDGNSVPFVLAVIQSATGYYNGPVWADCHAGLRMNYKHASAAGVFEGCRTVGDYAAAFAAFLAARIVANDPEHTARRAAIVAAAMLKGMTAR